MSSDFSLNNNSVLTFGENKASLASTSVVYQVSTALLVVGMFFKKF